FRADMSAKRCFARYSLTASSAIGRSHQTLRLLAGGGGSLAPAAVTLEHTGRREFAQLVPDHFFGHKQFHEHPSVVDFKRRTHEIRHDGAVARPRAERTVVVGPLLFLDLGQQSKIDVRAFLQRTTHNLSFPFSPGSISGGNYNLRNPSSGWQAATGLPTT